jgi:hypothetical protein
MKPKIDDKMVDRYRAITHRHDTVIGGLERKWGVARLEGLVPVEMAEKIRGIHEAANHSLWEGDHPGLVEQLYERLIGGWQAMDRVAAKAGHQPINPKQLEAVGADGGLVIIAEDIASIPRDGREAQVWTLSSVIKVLEDWQRQQSTEAVGAVMEKFPGATITGIRSTKREPFDDEIPF